MNWKICVIEIFNEIQYTCSESMHSRYSNVDTERIIMWYRTIILVKFDALDLRGTICTVPWNEFTCIITVTLLDTWINKILEDYFQLWRYLIGMVSKRRSTFLFLSYCKDKYTFQNWRWGPLIASIVLLRVRIFFGRKKPRLETTGLIW